MIYQPASSTMIPPTPILFRAGTAAGLLVFLQFVLANTKMEKANRRNLQHWLTGQAFLLVSYVLPINVCVTMLFASAALVYYLEVYQSKFFVKHFGAFLRKEEAVGDSRSGAFYFLLGTAVTAAIFPINTARFALQCLATVDPVASYFGRHVESSRINQNTTLAGSAAGFVTACAIGCFYLGFGEASWGKILVGALTCTIVEGSPYGNDNFMIPVLTSLVMEAPSVLQYKRMEAALLNIKHSIVG
ncbi:hypothetical protein MPSEU_000781600 [Mayamaea pseudoterrestris]|nr:hypothetical protein MPSEU_000781600 [Mayamaea pseudoterrestris]